MSVLPSYKPRKRPPWGTVPEDEREQTAAYIIAEWTRESPGMSGNPDPADFQKVVLQFMKEHNIQTIEDYEDSKVKALSE